MIGTGVSGFIWVGSCVWGACKQERCVASIAEGPGSLFDFGSGAVWEPELSDPGVWAYVSVRRSHPTRGRLHDAPLPQLEPRRGRSRRVRVDVQRGVRWAHATEVDVRTFRALARRISAPPLKASRAVKSAGGKVGTAVMASRGRVRHGQSACRARCCKNLRRKRLCHWFKK